MNFPLPFPKPTGRHLDHIGIAVRNLNESIPLFRRLLSVEATDQEVIKDAGVEAVFFQLQHAACIELIAPLTNQGAVARFLASRGEGMHHMAFLVEEIESGRKEMEAHGFKALTKKAQLGARGKLTYFFHPQDSGGVLIELCAQAPA